MTSSLQFSFCSVIALLCMVGALTARKLTKGRTNMLFFLLVIASFLSALFNTCDEAFVSWIIETNRYNLWIRYFVEYMYFIIHNAEAPLYILYIYSYSGLWYRLTQNKLAKWAFLSPYLISLVLIVSNAFHHQIFYIDSEFVYHRGPLMYVLYVAAFVYLVFAVITGFRTRKLLEKSKTILILTFMPIMTLAVLAQMIWPTLRVDVLTNMLLILIFSISIQRPEDNVDFVVEAQSYNAFVKECRKVAYSKSPTLFLVLKFTNHKILRDSLGLDRYSMLLHKISRKMEQISKIMNIHSEVYYLDHGAFGFISDVNLFEEVLDVGRVLLAYMQEPIKLDHLEVVLDSRICLMKFPNDIPSMDSLLTFIHTFHEKIPDNHRVTVLSDISESKEFRMKSDMDKIISRGISNFNFQMYYQPIYSIKEKKFVSAEALIRLKDDEYGMVSPALFIPEAEESGAIHQIGDFVIEDVCRFIGSSDFEDLGLKYIELNLSVAQCIEANLFEKITGYMEKYGVRPDQINLEITETSADYDPVVTDANIKKLSDYGLTFSLDDYGTGYSNITRVVSLPLNIVKLDKTLVDDMDQPMMWTVITNTVRMLKRMNKKILVEGVEEERALAKFAEIGCDYIQGYYFSKPLNETDFLKFILKENFGLV